jgi:lambda family phage portal protein
MQRLVLAEVETAGEILVHRVEVEDSLSPVPFKLELIDTDRLADEYFFRDRLQTEDGNEVRLGIEYDANGRPVAYHITEEHPNGLSLFRSIPKRIPAKDILHLYITERAGQGRGLSQFAPNVWWLKNLDRYVENEVVASAIASAISVVIKTMDGGAGGNTSLGDSLNGDTVSDQGNRFNFFEPGGVSQLLSSEEIEPFNNARGHSESAVFLNTMLRSMAVGAGLSFERLSRDYSQTNFSSNRASDLEDRKEFRILQQWLDFHFNEPVYQWLVEAGVRVGFEDFPTPSGYLADRDYWSEHEWQNPGWEWVDPRNEAQAADKGLRNGTINLVDYLAAQGINWEEHLDKIQKVQESLEQRGITLGMTEQIDLEDDIDADS